MNHWAEILKKKVSSAFSRFTPTIAAATFATIMSWVLPRLDNQFEAHELFKHLLLIGILFTGVSFLVTVYCRENQKKLWLGLLGGLFISVVFVYPSELEKFFWVQFFILNVVVYTMAFSIPFKKKATGLPHFLLITFTHFLESLFFSGAIYLGIAGLIGAVDLLFDFLPYQDIYQDLAKGIFGIFAVTYFLGVIPDMEGTFTYDQQGKIFKRLITYILMPVLIGYVLVLHAYFIKVLIEFQLPEGMVGNLVLWFAIVSFIVLYLSRDYGAFSPFSKRFQRFYPFALIIPLGMLFIALVIRVNAYGMTPERYFSFLVAVYVSICVALMRVSKKDITTLVVWFSIPLMVLSAFGPLSAERISYKSQLSRLESLLTEHNMLEDGKIKHNPELLTVDKEKIESQVIYLVDHFDTKDLTYIPSDFKFENSEEVFGFEFFRTYDRMRYFNVEALYNRAPVYKLEGADYLVRLVNYKDLSQYLEAPFKVAHALESKTLQVFKSDDVQEIAIESLVNEVRDKPFENPQRTLTYKDGTQVKLIFYFMELQGMHANDDSNDFEIGSYDVYVGIDLNP